MSIIPSPVQAIAAAVVVAMVSGGGWAIYHGIQVSAINKVALQQERLVAAENEKQYKLDIAALQQRADDARSLAEQLTAARAAIHATPSSKVCVQSPAGAAFRRIMRQPGSVAGATAPVSGKPVGVSGRTAVR